MPMNRGKNDTEFLPKTLMCYSVQARNNMIIRKYTAVFGTWCTTCYNYSFFCDVGWWIFIRSISFVLFFILYSCELPNQPTLAHTLRYNFSLQSERNRSVCTTNLPAVERDDRPWKKTKNFCVLRRTGASYFSSKNIILRNPHTFSFVYSSMDTDGTSCTSTTVSARGALNREEAGITNCCEAGIIHYYCKTGIIKDIVAKLVRIINCRKTFRSFSLYTILRGIVRHSRRYHAVLTLILSTRGAKIFSVTDPVHHRTSKSGWWART